MFASLGTTSAAAPVGQGSFQNMVTGTYSKPSFGGHMVGNCTAPCIITNTTTLYYFNIKPSFINVGFTKSPTSSYYSLTRIA
jgi:hypothetical protein